MSGPEARINDPPDLLESLGNPNGTTFAIGIPVQVSAQDARDIAASIREAVFACEALSVAYDNPVIKIEKDPSDPNSDLVVLDGILRNSQVIRSFVDDWYDSDGGHEPFDFGSEEAEQLYERLESKEFAAGFKFPELVDWFREAREDFDAWDPDANSED